MSEPQLTRLLDRAVHHAPPMHLDGEHLLTAGKGRVRRRRVLGAGGGLAAAALTVAVWGGLAGDGGPLTGELSIQPATTVFEQGEVVDAMLFDGFRTIDTEQAAHNFSGRLTRGVTGPLVLEVSDRGEAAERITAASPVPGLEVFAGKTMTVALWREPDGVVTSVPLVGPVDPGGPSSREQVEIEGEQFGYAVYAEDVQGVPVPKEFVDVYLLGRDGASALSGVPVEWVSLSGKGRAQVFADESRGVLGYVVHDQAPVLTQLGDRPAQVHSSEAVTKEGAEAIVILPQGATDHDVADDGTGGATFLGTRVLDRPFLMVWGGYGSVDAGAEVTFTLGGRSYDLAGYVQDLAELDLEDGSSMTVLPSVEPGSGLTTTSVGGSLVAVVENWQAGATVLADARVETAGPGGTSWVAPTDVAQVVLPDGRLVTALAVPALDSTTVTGVGMTDDEQIERWEPPVVAAGVEWRQVDGVSAPYVGGEPVPRVDDGSGDAFRHYRAEEGSARGYVVLPGTGAGATFAPLVLDDQGLRVSPEIVHQVDKVDVEGGQDTVLTVVGGLETDGASSIVAVAVQLAEAEGSANTWQVVGTDLGAHLVIDPGAVVTVAPVQGVWLLHPTGSVDPAELQAGRIGQDVLLLPADGAEVPTMVAVHPADAPPPRIGAAEGQQEATQTHEFDDHGLTVRVWTVEESTG